MKNVLLRWLGAGVLVASAAVGLHAACSITSDHFSCAVKTGDVLVRCVDYTDVSISLRVTAEALCRGLGGDFTIDTTCTNDKKVGGCKDVGSSLTQTSWYYEGSIAPTADEAKARCASGEMFIPVEGHPLGGSDMSVAHDLSGPDLPGFDLGGHD